MAVRGPVIPSCVPATATNAATTAAAVSGTTAAAAAAAATIAATVHQASSVSAGHELVFVLNELVCSEYVWMRPRVSKTRIIGLAVVRG